MTPVQDLINSLNTTISIYNALKSEAGNPTLSKKITETTDRIQAIAKKLNPNFECTSSYKHIEISGFLTLDDYRVCLLGCPEAVQLINQHLELDGKIAFFSPHFSFAERVQATAVEILSEIKLIEIQALINPKDAQKSIIWFALAPDDLFLANQISKSEKSSAVISLRLKQIHDKEQQ